MPICPTHNYYIGPFCGSCITGERSAEATGYRLFNEDGALGQNQYASRYIAGRVGYPTLGEGLRFKGDLDDYHSVYIHVDDYDEFHRRVKEHKHKFQIL